MKHAATPLIITVCMALAVSGGHRFTAILNAKDVQEIPPIQEKSSDTKKPDSPDVRSRPSETLEKKGDAEAHVSPNESLKKKEPSLPQKQAVGMPEKKQTAPSKKESAIPIDVIRKSARDAQAEKAQKGVATDGAAILIFPSYPTDHISFEGWREQMSYREIKNWARTYGLKALKPQGSDDGIRASFVSKHGSRVIIKHLDPLRHYYLWVHFVNYAKLTETDIHALLEIRVDRDQIARFSFADAMKKSEPFVFEIPYHHTVDGTLALEFREYSTTGGFFGIWNMALSDSIEQPNLFSPHPGVAKMIEPHSIIDKAELKSLPGVEKPGQTGVSSSPIDKTISPASLEKSSKKDIRLQKPHQKIKKNELKADKNSIAKSQLKKPDPKLETQKEAEARKMLRDDKNKDVRTQ